MNVLLTGIPSFNFEMNPKKTSLMKNSVLLSIALIFSMGFCFAQTNESLPEDARTFLDKHFPDEKIVDSEKFDQIMNSRESDFIDYDDQEAYEVELSNGISVEFGVNGKMTEMNSHGRQAIPMHALPDMIESYLKSNYMDMEVTGYEIDADDQEIELDNGIDLEFDMDGRFKEKD